MAKTLDLMFAGGGQIHVEGSEPAAFSAERGLDDAAERVSASFENALGTLRGIADGLQASLQRTASPPDVVRVQFGLKFDAEYGVVLAKGSVGANLDITMEWKKG